MKQATFSSLRWPSLHRRIQKGSNHAKNEHHMRVLTYAEELTLAKWLDEANKIQELTGRKSREEIIDKVVLMLKRRK